ncbi:unnamed protein product [Porites evermanni]|uniref:Uncharacterized protein n=1 Tax=Porites evermanni TaxID=104178 RepID=A0ABN8MC67_9CNID|nr:unnamed protein product [Porites evermanni]
MSVSTSVGPSTSTSVSMSPSNSTSDPPSTSVSTSVGPSTSTSVILSPSSSTNVSASRTVVYEPKDGECQRVCCDGAGGPIKLMGTCSPPSECQGFLSEKEEEGYCPGEVKGTCQCNKACSLHSPSFAVLAVITLHVSLSSTGSQSVKLTEGENIGAEFTVLSATVELSQGKATNAVRN